MSISCETEGGDIILSNEDYWHPFEEYRSLYICNHYSTILEKKKKIGPDEFENMLNWDHIILNSRTFIYNTWETVVLFS